MSHHLKMLRKRFSFMFFQTVIKTLKVIVRFTIAVLVYLHTTFIYTIRLYTTLVLYFFQYIAIRHFFSLIF